MVCHGTSGGYRLALAARLDDGAPAVIVRVILDNPLVACIEAAFPVKAIESARRFVAHADQAVFDRAMEQMAPHLEEAASFISGMNKAIEAKKETKHDYSSHKRIQPWHHRADRAS